MNRSLRYQTPERQPVSRVPLYPIGPTLNHQGYQPIYQMPKKFSSFANMTLPSYQERLLQRQKQHSKVRIPHQQQQRALISRNEAEIDNEHRRRKLMHQSYLRQIQSLQIKLAKDDQRKQKLKSQIQLYKLDQKQLISKVQDARVNMPRYQPQQGLQNKQLQVMQLKNMLITRLKQKQEQLLKQRSSQQDIWQQKLKDKQKTLITYEEQRNSARNQLLKLRRQQQINIKQLPSAIADIARSRKYQQFKYDFDVLKQKISQINQERLISNRDFQKTNQVKTTIIKDQQFKLQSLRRVKIGLLQNINEIKLRNTQLQKSNNNLEQQNLRKQQLIILYQNDIQLSRKKAEENDAQINTKLNEFRGRKHDQFLSNLKNQIQEVEKSIREVQSDTYRLRGDYKKIGEYLQSQITKSIYQTFNDVKTE